VRERNRDPVKKKECDQRYKEKNREINRVAARKYYHYLKVITAIYVDQKPKANWIEDLFYDIFQFER